MTHSNSSATLQRGEHRKDSGPVMNDCVADAMLQQVGVPDLGSLPMLSPPRSFNSMYIRTKKEKSGALKMQVFPLSTLLPPLLALRGPNRFHLSIQSFFCKSLNERVRSRAVSDLLASHEQGFRAVGGGGDLSRCNLPAEAREQRHIRGHVGRVRERRGCRAIPKEEGRFMSLVQAASRHLFCGGQCDQHCGLHGLHAT